MDVTWAYDEIGPVTLQVADYGTCRGIGPVTLQAADYGSGRGIGPVVFQAAYAWWPV